MIPDLPQFTDAIAQVTTLALQHVDREIVEKHLCYHTRDHVQGVQRRAQQIFQVIHPYLNPDEDLHRLELLLDLCAIAHDLVQIFLPPTELHAPRRREAGVSETATIAQLFIYIQELGLDHAQNAFTASDLAIIQAAIAATICDYDPIEQAIFQPALYRQDPPIGWVARILALADLGTLGMEGIEAYNTEGRLLFLEENPDLRSRLSLPLTIESADRCENIRQRLLKRTRFQVNLAKSRLQRCPRELTGLPTAAIPILLQEVFPYLTPETIAHLEVMTPTAADTSLDTLITFFGFQSGLTAIP